MILSSNNRGLQPPPPLWLHFHLLTKEYVILHYSLHRGDEIPAVWRRLYVALHDTKWHSTCSEDRGWWEPDYWQLNSSRSERARIHTKGPRVDGRKKGSEVCERTADGWPCQISLQLGAKYEWMHASGIRDFEIRKAAWDRRLEIK